MQLGGIPRGSRLEVRDRFHVREPGAKGHFRRKPGLEEIQTLGHGPCPGFF